MLSVAAYKVVHIFGVLLLFVALGAALGDGSRRRLASMTHGIGLLIVLIAGFGALARLGIHSPGSWPLVASTLASTIPSGRWKSRTGSLFRAATSAM